MPHAKLRLLVYGGLACALGGAVIASSQRSPSPAAKPHANAKLRQAGPAILGKYLASLPEGAPPDALMEIQGLKESILARLLDWLPTPPEQRPMTLIDTGLDSGSALFAALLQASLTGYKPAPLNTLPELIQQLPLAQENPLRLRLLNAAAAHAHQQGQRALALQLLADAARHPSAGWEQIRTLVELATTGQQPASAIEMLQDWLDDPPANTPASQRQEARTALARLLLLDNQTNPAWAVLQPLLDQETAAPPEVIELAWTVAAAASQTGQLVTPLETHLRRHLTHRLHWRELADAAPPEAAYLTGLRRLGAACLAAGEDSRAVDLHLHLAWLENPRHLLPALPAAMELERRREVLDLLERLDEIRPPPAGSHALMLAAFSLEQGEHAIAQALLEAHLRRQPQDKNATRLHLQVQSAALPPLQAALLWKRHLQQHPGDTEAQRLLSDTWLRGGQPGAAINHLLSLRPEQLDASLRLRLAELAAETRHSSALATAMQRLQAAGDEVPQEKAAAWTGQLAAAGRRERTDQLKTR